MSSTAYTYSNNGNITQKSDVGTYAYGSQQPHAVLSMTNVNNTNIAPATQNVTYTPFDRTASISEGVLNLQFTYGPSYDRKKTQLYTNGQLTRTRIYSGLYEKTTEGNTITEVHYVAAGDGVCALHVIENGVGTTYYVYKDHLGSYRAITDGSGNLVAEQNYDAWGRERNPSDWSYTLTANKPKWLYRGYTGHEMLPEFGLVNMNNRLYDPLLGRMLAVDNFVQNPYSTQSYNRYSYVLNNPMSYVDPSGEVVVPAAFIIVGAIVGAYAGGTIANGGQLNPMQWDRSWKTVGGILVGGALGAIGGYYVGAGIKGAGALEVVTKVTVPGVGSVGTVWNGTGGFSNLHWTTSAGGSGGVDFNNNPKVRQTSGSISGNYLDAGFYVRNENASGLQIIQTFYGTRRLDGRSVGAYSWSSSGKIYDAFVDGGVNSPYVTISGNSPAHPSNPYYYSDDELRDYSIWNGTNGGIVTSDRPSSIYQHEMSRFETIIIATNFNNSGKDRILGAFRWGWDNYGSTPIHNGIEINSLPSQLSLDIIKHDYPWYSFY